MAPSQRELWGEWWHPGDVWDSGAGGSCQAGVPRRLGAVEVVPVRGGCVPCPV